MSLLLKNGRVTEMGKLLWTIDFRFFTRIAARVATALSSSRPTSSLAA
jgi:hypothetical protein